MFSKNLPVVLLVEDSPDDAELARRALTRSGVACRLIVAEQGDEALKLLGEPDAESAAPPLRPSLILLDLNTPGMRGRELLRRLKSNDEWCSIPVVVLSTSRHPGDIEGCYRSHANAYHTKSDDLAAFQNTLRQIVEYWLTSAVPSPVSAEAAGACAPPTGPVAARTRRATRAPVA